MELVFGELERLVIWVVGDDEDVVVIGATPDALDKRPLDGVEDVCFVPLEKQTVKGYTLTGDEVAGIICRLHGVALDLNKEVGAFESRNNVTFTFILHYRRVVSEWPCHRA